MKCPACDNTLTEINISDILVDICKGGCGGIWFDNFELEKFDEKHEHAGEALLDIERDKNITIDYEAKRNCPRCQDTKMLQHSFSVKQKVVIDECGQCAGIWLDAGELRAIRDLYGSEEERRKAVDNYFSEVFDSDLGKMKAQSQAELARAKKVARIFRFICPSYYVPGKQAWGAY